MRPPPDCAKPECAELLGPARCSSVAEREPPDGAQACGRSGRPIAAIALKTRPARRTRGLGREVRTPRRGGPVDVVLGDEGATRRRLRRWDAISGGERIENTRDEVRAAGGDLTARGDPVREIVWARMGAAADALTILGTARGARPMLMVHGDASPRAQC